MGTSALYPITKYSSNVSSRACRLLFLLLELLPQQDCTAATTSSLGARPQNRTSESATTTMNAACHTCSCC